MKKLYKSLVVLFVSLIMFGAPKAALAASDFSYAVVDVQQVVAASKEVKALRDEQNAKMRELSKFAQDANKKIQAETDVTKKKALETKLNKEFATKRAASEKDYANKLKNIDKNITKIISQKATQKGFDLVLAKGVVLYSTGTDITEELVKAVK